jgi:hypothetical protein
MGSNDQEKIKIAREYFVRVDQGRPNILELFHEDGLHICVHAGFCRTGKGNWAVTVWDSNQLVLR